MEIWELHKSFLRGKLPSETPQLFSPLCAGPLREDRSPPPPTLRVTVRRERGWGGMGGARKKKEARFLASAFCLRNVRCFLRGGRRLKLVVMRPTGCGEEGEELRALQVLLLLQLVTDRGCKKRWGCAAMLARTPSFETRPFMTVKPCESRNRKTHFSLFRPF